MSSATRARMGGDQEADSAHGELVPNGFEAIEYDREDRIVYAGDSREFGFCTLLCSHCGLGASSVLLHYIVRDLGLSVSQSLMIASIPNIIGWLAISFAHDYSFLYMGRLLEGFGVGVISYTVSLYVQGSRRTIHFPFQFVSEGGSHVAFAGSYSGILPCTILIPGLFFIPESPRWLAKMGMTEDFEISLQVLWGFETDISAERSVASSSPRTAIRFLDLKQRRYYIPLMVGIGLLALQQAGGVNGILFYSSAIFEAAGHPSSNLVTLILGAVQVVATGISVWLADRAGRRILLIIASVGSIASLVLVAVVFYLKGFISESSYFYSVLSILSVVGLVAFIVAFSLELGSILWVVMSEVHFTLSDCYN
ncbi:hypothetical protein Sjap_016925 [Stephania japonica]|uniref:Major facilitator superfamily (MFS) profile domain-containing protein n=1 Tax=Stephania japonica TaxID=461633 RepID=A0AAP0NJR4_9MAGN